ncbi:NAD(P)-dependent alcohol dehydrogenase [Rhodococcus tibetensis]|uniref:NAD(P)-dependent alcohol dehydrogenase n=1 Tax=Rhodococcus tibetensis TaxID=2965064 RepID=A0ABT1Q859_9NOCA|nr:NAD(P)-dependent alcohol dehydrogenase [Rhodococcus sp. FXJ9.536]MCQ4117913.1 NAD(P)-dependent alcohol dehydrogenase [Rhodococcus sp. FXJ9.536]
MLMKAALSRGPEYPFSLETVELDRARPDEVVVRIVATGLCHTDLFAKSVLPAALGPAVFGHEGAGVVEEVGALVETISPGDHVVLTYRHCGACRQCRGANPAYCERAHQLNSSGSRPDGSTTITLDGERVRGAFFGQSSFSEYVVATADNVVVVDKSVDLITAAPFGCGFQTGAGAVLNVLAPEEDSSMVVFGAGSVGFAALLAARARRVATLCAVDPLPARRALAEEFGAVSIDPTTQDVAAEIRALTGGGATHTLDTTGIPTVIGLAVSALRERGTAVVVGLGAPEVTVDIQDLMRKGKTLRGCIEGDSSVQSFIPQLLALHSEGRFPVDRLITRYSFEDINRAVADQASGSVVKPVLVW